MPFFLSTQEKIEIVLICGEHYKSAREAAIIFNQRHPDKTVHFSTVSRIMKKFLETGSVENQFKVSHKKTVTNDENSLNVVLTVTETPQITINKISESTNIESRSIRRILKNNRFHPYKPKFIQVLRDRDYDARFDFCAWYQGNIEEDSNFPKKIIFSDEATFNSNGTVSSQNCRWWATENPKFTIANKDQYSFKVNVWCGIFRNRLVGPFFFRENLNGESYLHFLKHEFTEFLDNLALNERRNVYFQQDGASIHCSKNVIRWLRSEFENKWIGRYSENPWPARSPDLTPLDFFLWGYLKNHVYKHRPFRDINHLEEVIRYYARQITPRMIKNVLIEMNSRTILCMQREGRHIEF